MPATTYLRGGATRGLIINDALEQEDIIRTSPNGSTRVRFLDDTMLTVGPNAEIRLDKGVFEGSQARTLSIEVISGAMRFVSGVSSRNSYEIRTPVATIGVRGTVVDISHNGNRAIVNFVDGAGSICMAGSSECRNVNAGDAALAISPTGFSPATAAEAARLWRQLDGAHLALARQAGRDPSKASGAATGAKDSDKKTNSDNGRSHNGTTGSTDTATSDTAGSTTTTGGSLSNLPGPPIDHIISATNPITPVTTVTAPAGPNFPASFTVFRVNGRGGDNLPFQLENQTGSRNGFFYVPVSTVTYDPGTNDARSITLSRMPDLANEPTPVTLTRASGAGGAQSQVTIGTAVLPGEGSSPVPAYFLSTWSNGTVNYSVPGITSGSFLLGPNQAFPTIGWGYTGDLFVNPVSFGGLVLFNLEKATNPAWSDGHSAPGTFTGGQVAVAIGTASLRYGMVGTVVMNEGSFTMSTPGGVTDPTQSLAIGAISGQVARVQTNNGSVNYVQSGPTNACPNTCYANMEFNTIAPGKIAAVYALGDGQNFDNGNNPVEITGIATFAKPPSSNPSPLTPSAGFVSFSDPYGGIGYSTGPASGTLQITPNGPALQSVHQDIGYIRTQGTAVSADIGSIPGILGWERWTGGTFTNESNQTFTIPTDGGLHFVHGLPAINLPSNGLGAPPPGLAVQYSLAGATSPTVTNGLASPGVLLPTSKMGIDFTNLKVGVDLFVGNGVGLGGGKYEINTPGGASNPSLSSIALTGALFNSGGPNVDVNVITPGTNVACTALGNCKATITGFLAGDGVGTNGGGNSNGQAPPYLGLNYSFGNTGGPLSGFVSGAAAFGRDVPVGNVVGYAFSSSTNTLPAGSSTMALGGGPAWVIGDTTTPSGLALGYINVDHGNGTFQDFDRGAFGSPSPGVAQVAEQGTVAGILSWERWTNGTVNDQNCCTPYSISASQGIHVINGVAATNIPTSGTYTYNLVGATRPTMADGSHAPGTLTGGSTVGVAFGSTPKFGVNLNVQIGGGTYNMLSSGGSAAPSLSATNLLSSGLLNASNIPTTYSGAGPSVVCPAGNCKANVNGFLAGKGASHLGILYQFGNTATSPSQIVSGGAGFAR